MPCDKESDTRTTVQLQEPAYDLPLLGTQYICSSTGSVQLLGDQAGTPFTVLAFESLYKKQDEKNTLTDTVKKTLARKWKKFSAKKSLQSNFPTLSEMRKYKLREYLPSDFVAGLTVGITMIPQGLAFAVLSTLPPIVGLYMSFFASLAYFFIGTCHQLSWGCIAILSILTGKILDDYDTKTRAAFSVEDDSLSNLTAASVNSSSDGVSNSTISMFVSTVTSSHNSRLVYALSTERKIEVACAVTMMSGIILAALGKLGLGRLTLFMSDSLVTSFTVGVSFHVVTSQAKTALGLDFLPRQSGIFKLVHTWESLLCNLHKANAATTVISFTCIALLYAVKRFVNEKFKSRLRVPVPIELFVIIIATIVSSYTGISDKFSVKVVKEIPVGLPKPKVPDLSLGVDYFTDGLVIIFLSFTQNVAMAKLMGLKHNYRIDTSQEMFACGAVSVVCSLFSGYFAGPSVSRSILQDGAGGKTQVASLFAAALVLLVIMVMGPYIYYLPTCVLAAIIIVNLRSMFLKLLTVPELWGKSRVDCLVWVITCLTTIFLETDVGLLVGIIVSILFILLRSQTAGVDVVTEIAAGENVCVWRSEEWYAGGRTADGVKVVRINSAVYFANAEIITEQVFKKTGVNPVKLARSENSVNCVYNNGEMNHVAGTNARDSELTNTEDKEHSFILGAENVLLKSANSRVPFSTLLVDLSAVPFLDVMGVQSLEFLLIKYKAVGVDVYFVNLQETCVDMLHRNGFLTKHKEHVFVSMAAAQRHLKL